MGDFDDKLAGLRERKQALLDEMTLVRTGRHEKVRTPEQAETFRREAEQAMRDLDVEIAALDGHNKPA